MTDDNNIGQFDELLSHFSPTDSVYKVLSIVNDMIPFQKDTSIANITKVVAKFNRLKRTEYK